MSARVRCTHAYTDAHTRVHTHIHTTIKSSGASQQSTAFANTITTHFITSELPVTDQWRRWWQDHTIIVIVVLYCIYVIVVLLYYCGATTVIIVIYSLQGKGSGLRAHLVNSLLEQSGFHWNMILSNPIKIRPNQLLQVQQGAVLWRLFTLYDIFSKSLRFMDIKYKIWYWAITKVCPRKSVPGKVSQKSILEKSPKKMSQRKKFVKKKVLKSGWK